MCVRSLPKLTQPWTDSGVKHFFIISRDDRPEYVTVIEGVMDYIRKRGGVCSYGFNPEDGSGGCIDVPRDTQCILTVGGDGTLIRAAQNTVGREIPLLGVNCGHLGYLCDLDEDSVYAAIDSLFEDEYEVEERMMLSGYIRDRAGKQCSEPSRALNDIVLSGPAGAGLQVINLTVSVNGEYLYSYNCDGMIFATPTGSTAYNLSANGPIADPRTNLILITPINPHTLNARSIVIDHQSQVFVEIRSRRNDMQETALVSFDGSNQQILHPGETLVLYKAVEKSRMIRFNKMNYLERIRSKMQEI